MFLLGATASLLTACGKKIGDECETSLDCNPEGAWTCDRSQPGGYCTVDGCDHRSCPDDAVCIRFFPGRFLTMVCDPPAEDTPGGTDDCGPDELCLPEGRCAPRASERRFCAASCGENGDCRGGYVCRESGSEGTVALLPTPGATARFCAPRQ